MALVQNGVKVDLASSYVPSGYTLPTVTTFTDYLYFYDQTLSVDKTTVDDPTEATTMAAIVADLTSQINVILNADFTVATLTVTAYCSFYEISSNLSLDDNFYTNDATSYECKLKVYVKTS